MNRDVGRDLYIRGVATLLASWEEYARGSAGAALRRLNGVSAAVFPSEPERAFYNNALVARDLGPTERAVAVHAMEAAYHSAGIDRYAAWVHESDEGMRAELSGRGYTIEESTRAMGMSFSDLSPALPEVELGPPDWAEYLRILGVPPPACSAAPTRAPFTSSWRAWRARTSRPRWPTTTTATAACSTW